MRNTANALLGICGFGLLTAGIHILFGTGATLIVAGIYLISAAVMAEQSDQ